MEDIETKIVDKMFGLAQLFHKGTNISHNMSGTKGEHLSSTLIEATNNKEDILKRLLVLAETAYDHWSSRYFSCSCFYCCEQKYISIEQLLKFVCKTESCIEGPVIRGNLCTAVEYIGADVKRYISNQTTDKKNDTEGIYVGPLAPYYYWRGETQKAEERADWQTERRNILYSIYELSIKIKETYS